MNKIEAFYLDIALGVSELDSMHDACFRFALEQSAEQLVNRVRRSPEVAGVIADLFPDEGNQRYKNMLRHEKKERRKKR